MKLAKMPITLHQYQQFSFYIKRDDLLHPYFSGNKARKLKALLDLSDDKITHLISYGSAQANSFLSFAALANLKKWQCEFYVDRIPDWLCREPIGNYKYGLELGAKVIAVSELTTEPLHPRDYIERYKLAEHVLFVPEGGHSPLAEQGVSELGQEIVNWVQTHHIINPVIALPSGTGTTALYLYKYVKPYGIDLITCACVGGEDYLLAQFNALGENDFPTILSLDHKHHFGKLYQTDYQIWLSLLNETKVEFDLLYDPRMWQCLLKWLPENKDKTLIYLHQGGLIGNASMKRRYQRKYPLA